MMKDGIISATTYMEKKRLCFFTNGKALTKYRYHVVKEIFFTNGKTPIFYQNGKRAAHCENGKRTAQPQNGKRAAQPQNGKRAVQPQNGKRKMVRKMVSVPPTIEPISLLLTSSSSLKLFVC